MQSPTDQQLGELNFNFDESDMLSLMAALDGDEKPEADNRGMADDTLSLEPSSPATLPPSPGISSPGSSLSRNSSMGEQFVNINDILSLPPAHRNETEAAIVTILPQSCQLPSNPPSPPAAVLVSPFTEIKNEPGIVMEIDLDELNWMSNSLSLPLEPSEDEEEEGSFDDDIDMQTLLANLTKPQIGTAMSPSTQSYEISDDELLELTVRDLNRRVSGMTKDEVKAPTNLATSGLPDKYAPSVVVGLSISVQA